MNRLAWGLVCLVFLLICSGGLVTAYGAGMAIPDWPKTFGYWVYPPHRWLGRHDCVFLNQLHRTLAQLALVWAVVLAVRLWRSCGSRKARILAPAVVIGVMVQGAVGGWRVFSGSLPVAAIHAATAQLVLGLCMAVAVVASKNWLAAQPVRGHRDANSVRRWCLATVLLAYMLILVDAQIRHVPPTAGLSWLPFWVLSRLTLTVLVVIAAGRLMLLAGRRFGDCPTIVRRIGWLVGLLTAQLLLGGAAWVTRYGWPPWFADYVFPISYTVVAGGSLQRLVAVSHIVVGSLVMAVGVNAAMWTYRSLPEAGSGPAG